MVWVFLKLFLFLKLISRDFHTLQSRELCERQKQKEHIQWVVSCKQKHLVDQRGPKKSLRTTFNNFGEPKKKKTLLECTEYKTRGKCLVPPISAMDRNLRQQWAHVRQSQIEKRGGWWPDLDESPFLLRLQMVRSELDINSLNPQSTCLVSTVHAVV